MIELIIIMLVALLVIAGATALSPRVGVATPLVLVAVGVGASFLPVFTAVRIEPELILAGILPPLLYSAAVSMPTMNFRREFGAIGGLSVILVLSTALTLGLFFMLVLPGLGFAWGVALGAIISPTDAVAVSILKRTPVSKRVVAILEGEGLLNDATALVLLRTAIAAAAASFSFWGAVGGFAYSVIIAVAIGAVVGWGNLIIRKRVTDPTINTVLSFTVPFVASVPAELLHASGLVAAVVAGLITGIRAPRVLSPQHRLSDTQNWRTVELVLEGTVFLTMGLQIKSIITSAQTDHAGGWTAVLIALGALALTILIRAAYVAPLLGALARRAERGAKIKAHAEELRDRIRASATPQRAADQPIRTRPMSNRDRERASSRFTRAFADIDYFVREPLYWQAGAAIVWAGMRGAITVAAAQTLPENTPQRSILILIAYTVAALSLLIQGGTIGPLVRRITTNTPAAEIPAYTTQRQQLFSLLKASTESITQPVLATEPTPEGFAAAKRYRMKLIGAQRIALLNARDQGTFDADFLADALANLDADQIAIELRGAPDIAPGH